jgi:hypothetical protein
MTLILPFLFPTTTSNALASIIKLKLITLSRTASIPAAQMTRAKFTNSAHLASLVTKPVVEAVAGQALFPLEDATAGQPAGNLAAAT